ncbi:hypothetical protein AAFF_G00170370 [Aldrovandia affinis]|uniref:Uncharacterized protein n=1 Tax=Aldrovandia affinis TaxID=143900 RepID=A0AAD7RLU2_9TELE|nr:hypothetical protein AAFF_G00170370 [Aldrovandia affinis]
MWCFLPLSQVDRIIFCVFLDTDFRIYKEKMFRLFSQDNDVSDDGDETQAEEGKKDKKSKNKKLSKGAEDCEAKEEKNNEDSTDANMDSQKEEDDQSNTLEVEMESQNLDATVPDSEDMKEKKDEKEKVITPDLSRREDRTVVGDRQSVDIESAVDAAESRSSSGKDEAQLPQMVTAGTDGCLNKDPPAEMDSTMEAGGSGEPMESEDVEGEPVLKDKESDEETDTSTREPFSYFPPHP